MDDPLDDEPSAPEGLAIASLVLGLLALFLSPIVVGVVLGTVGVGLGAAQLRRRGNAGRSMATWGVTLSALGLVASLAVGFAYYRLFRSFSEETAGGGAPEDEEETSLDGWTGAAAPALALTTVDGRAVSLADLKGKRVVLDFWATWCPPCRKEIPHFKQLAAESGDDLVILGISEEDAETLRSFGRQEGINYPLVSAESLPEPFHDVESIPTTVFLDRQGLIQSVLNGYQDYDTLKAHALAEDLPGPAKAPPRAAAEALVDAARALAPAEAWSLTLPRASGLAACDWDGDGAPELLVSGGDGRLHVFDFAGAEKATVSLPEHVSRLECGRGAGGALRVLAYSNWSDRVRVLDATGKELWSYPSDSRDAPGVDGAHWGDLDGDGVDELVVGFNGSGGLHAVSSDGSPRWTDTSLGNVWNQAVVSARGGAGATVLATEAGGSVRVYDGAGKAVKRLRPQGRYYADMTAGAVDASRTVQIVANGKGRVLAFDTEGSVAWQTPSVDQPGSWRGGAFASADVDGDGTRDWAFLQDARTLVVASSRGERLADVPLGDAAEAFELLGAAGRPALVVVLAGDEIRAYRLDPVAVASR